MRTADMAMRGRDADTLERARGIEYERVRMYRVESKGSDVLMHIPRFPVFELSRNASGSNFGNREERSTVLDAKSIDPVQCIASARLLNTVRAFCRFIEYAI